MKLALASGLATVAVTGAVLFVATSSSSALNCPQGTVPWTVVSNPVSVGACKPAPYPPCDPGPCDPTAIAPQD